MGSVVVAVVACSASVGALDATVEGGFQRLKSEVYFCRAIEPAIALQHSAEKACKAIREQGW